MTHKFTLYLAGEESIKSLEIITCVRDHLTERLKGKFTLTVVDVIKFPELARKEEIFVTPSWVRDLPKPKRKIIGNFCAKNNVIKGLDIFLE